MPGAHALLSPSSAARWMNCTKSVRLNEKFIERFGEEQSSYAEEGTKAHALAELKLRYFLHEIDKPAYVEAVSQLGDVPSEMERATDYYVDICEERYIGAKNECPDAMMLVEQRLDLTEWAPDCWGTGDCIIVSDERLVVIDLKYGKGVPVDAHNNPQTRCYGLGALHEFGDLYAFPTVETIIIQPRLDSVSAEAMAREILLAWGEELKPRARLAYDGEGDFEPGPWCKFCNARAVCARRVASALQIVETGLAAPDTIDDHTIAGIYKALPLIKDWIGTFEEHVQKQALRGCKYEGLKLVRGKRPARKFKDEGMAIDVLRNEGCDPSMYMTEPELKSVAAIEKAIGKAKFKDLLEEQVVQGEGALVLVPEDDKREEYSSADADFTDLIQ